VFKQSSSIIQILVTIIGEEEEEEEEEEESCNRPSVAQRVPGGLGSQIS
jgi:hypothetical protein